MCTESLIQSKILEISLGAIIDVDIQILFFTLKDLTKGWAFYGLVYRSINDIFVHTSYFKKMPLSSIFRNYQAICLNKL